MREAGEAGVMALREGGDRVREGEEGCRWEEEEREHGFREAAGGRVAERSDWIRVVS